MIRIMPAGWREGRMPDKGRVCVWGGGGWVR